jgi:hypothetical protein
MAHVAIVLIYIAFSLLTGLCGTQRRLGFFGTFIISLLITPVVMLLVLILTAPSGVERQHDRRGN